MCRVVHCGVGWCIVVVHCTVAWCLEGWCSPLPCNNALACSMPGWSMEQGNRLECNPLHCVSVYCIHGSYKSIYSVISVAFEVLRFQKAIVQNVKTKQKTPVFSGIYQSLKFSLKPDYFFFFGICMLFCSLCRWAGGTRNGQVSIDN